MNTAKHRGATRPANPGSRNRKKRISRPPVAPSERKVLLFNKPYDVLCQFTDQDNRATLADYVDVAGVYAAGRLDRDSEGLLVLTNDGKLQSKLASPRFKTSKTYWVQVEGLPDEEALEKLRNGIELKDGPTRPARIRRLDTPTLPARTPPVRFRKNIPDCWLEITLTEGRNRQVRRMTAAVGHPTLRLVRYRIGNWTLDGIEPGQYVEVAVPAPTTAPSKRK